MIQFPLLEIATENLILKIISHLFHKKSTYINHVL